MYSVVYCAIICMANKIIAKILFFRGRLPTLQPNKPSKFSKVLYGRVSGAGVRQEYAVLRASKTELSPPADQVDRHERVPVSAAHPRRRQDATRHLQESTKC